MLLERRVALVGAVLAAAAVQSVAAQPDASAPRAALRNMPYADARPVIDALRPDLLPEPLRGLAPEAREAAWPGWVASRDRAIRARLARGDDDTVVNFLLYGATFTGAPRSTPEQVAALARADAPLPDVVAARIDDFIDAVAAGSRTERIEFARSVLLRNGRDPDTPSGRVNLRSYLAGEVRRGPAETLQISRSLDRALDRSDPDAALLERTAFRGRGLSSDTSILVDFGIDEALRAAHERGLLRAGGIRRMAVVGPGLDFTDKDEGYDIYPIQTVQPFAVIDSLLALGLTEPGQLQVTALDLNPRIVRHLEQARARASAGRPYVLALPRNLDLAWSGELAAYWERLGAAIGAPAAELDVPPSAGNVQVRTVRVRPEIVLAVKAADLNIVLQRLAPLQADERFDLIVATDILIYYDTFEQSLALMNLTRMLSTSGLLLANTPVAALPGMPLSAIGHTDVTYMPLAGLGGVRDRFAWYRRR